ncbi:MAG: endonuclease/exonuclease/phosphatase family protein [bacterium]
MRKILYKLLLFINFLFLGTLILSYLSVFVNPGKFWIAAFFGLSYPYILLVNIGFMFFWLFKTKKAFLLSFIGIAAGWMYLTRVIQVNSKEQNVNLLHGKSFKVLTYNVRDFNRFNWANDKDAREKILKFIKMAEADIICIQEFSLDQAAELLMDFKDTTYYYFHSTSLKSQKNYGMAIFSKYPILRREYIDLGHTTNGSIFCDILLDTDTVRIFNNHLQSIHFIKQDYDFIDSIQSNYHSFNVAKFSNMVKRMKLAYVKRSAQVNVIAPYIQKSPYPVIVCGDFNDTPISYTYQKMKGDLEDSFVKAGAGFSNTYAGKFPSFRIDYILQDSQVEAFNYKRYPVKFSDHYPVSCEFVLK